MNISTLGFQNKEIGDLALVEISNGDIFILKDRGDSLEIIYKRLSPKQFLNASQLEPHRIKVWRDHY